MGATSAGAPTSGTFAVGDFIIDDTAIVWICTAAGTPGTWSPSIQSNVVVRSATATAGQGELTIYGTSGTSGQTITLPASPQNGAIYQIKNLSSYNVNILGGTSSISISGVVYSSSTPYTIIFNCAYTFVYTGGVWYCMVTTDLAKMGNTLPVTFGGTGNSGYASSNLALYTTSNVTIAAGTLPIVAGGTGLTSVGTAGQALVVNSGATGLTYTTINIALLQNALTPVIGGNTAVAETVTRTMLNASLSPATGTLRVNAVYLTAGTVVNNISFNTTGTAAASVTGTWGGIFTASGTTLTLVAATAQQGVSSLAATTLFTWPIATIASGSSSTYTVPSTGIYYIGVCITASTMPTMSAINGTALNSVQPPIGFLMTGSTNPASIGTTYTGTQATLTFYYVLT
jgi:hypothetical protein